MTTDLDVAVVGAGMAGLAAAHELRRAGRDVRVFEAESTVGGRMRTLRRDGYLIDTGAEQISLRGYRATWELLRRCGITADALHHSGRPMGAWRAGRVHRGVGDPAAVFTGAGLGPAARLSLARFLAWSARHRAAFDHDHPERTPLGGATVADLAGRYHPELLDRLLDPLTRAFFGWDPARSAAAPLVALLLAVGPVSAWRAYPGGMDLLARRLADDLDVVTGQCVEEVTDDGATARLTVGGRTLTARDVVLAVPAPVAARLHANPAADEAGYLAASTFRPMLKVMCALDRPLAPDPRSYAVLTPACEDSTLAGVIADHLRCPDRAPVGRGLLGLMAAPPRIPELLALSPREAADRLTAAAERYVPGLRAACVDHLLVHWPDAMPELTPRALAERPAFLARPARSVEYAGDWVAARPSSEGAVRSGALAASRVMSRRPAPVSAPAPAQEAA